DRAAGARSDLVLTGSQRDLVSTSLPRLRAGRLPGREVGGVDLDAPLPFTDRILAGVLVVRVDNTHELGRRIGLTSEVLRDHLRSYLRGAVRVRDSDANVLEGVLSRHIGLEKVAAMALIGDAPVQQESLHGLVDGIRVGVGVLSCRGGLRVPRTL